MIAVKRTVATVCKVVILNVLCLRSDGRRCVVCSRIESGILLHGQTDTICRANMPVSSLYMLLLHFHVAVLARNFRRSAGERSAGELFAFILTGYFKKSKFLI